ncbi:MAG: hypothetical protein EDX89_22580 [Acidobacteria bacterium]|nr:MAG: hypothetical protein EDX89_22580 [Acidobacteriota bacterium]
MTTMEEKTEQAKTEALLRAKDMSETAFRMTLAELRITFGDFQRLRDSYESMNEAARELKAHQREAKDANQ